MAENQEVIIQNSIEVFKSAPAILQANQQRTSKAIAIGNGLLNEWHTAWNIQDEDARLEALAALDVRSNKYLVNCSNALSEERQARAAITQMMDNFKGYFLEAERDLDRDKVGTPPEKIRNWRNQFAKEAAQIEARKKKEAEDKANRAKEAIDLKAKCELVISDYQIRFLKDRKETIQAQFNAATLDSYEAFKTRLDNYNPSSTILEVPNTGGIFGRYHNADEIDQIMMEAWDRSKKDILANIAAEMASFKEELQDLLPSKLAELEEQERLRLEKEENNRKAREAKNEQDRKDAERRNEEIRLENERLEQERKKREDERQRQLDQEAADKKDEEKLRIELSSQGEQTMADFEKAVDVAEITKPKAEVRTGYEIKILHPVGWTQIFQLWWEKVGMNLPVDKIGATKMDSMKAWAEKEALKGTKIESKFLTYEETFKTVARKTKAVAE